MPTLAELGTIAKAYGDEWRDKRGSYGVMDEKSHRKQAAKTGAANAALGAGLGAVAGAAKGGLPEGALRFKPKRALKGAGIGAGVGAALLGGTAAAARQSSQGRYNAERKHVHRTANAMRSSGANVKVNPKWAYKDIGDSRKVMNRMLEVKQERDNAKPQ